jgi:SAM-dependent methyltransferase
MDAVNDYQYSDLQTRAKDQYAGMKYEIILQYLRYHRALKILNAGCGSGELSFLLARAGHTVTGIDPVPEYIDLAWQNAAAGPDLPVTFSVSTIEEYASPKVFDCVVATDVLEHIEDDCAAFRKLVRHVSPGGLVIITVPAGQWLFGYHDEALGHFRRYSSASLRKLVTGECEVQALRYFGFTLIPICYLYSKLLRKPYPVAESGDSSKKPISARILHWLLRLDKVLPMPVGTSLLMLGRCTRNMQEHQCIVRAA